MCGALTFWFPPAVLGKCRACDITQIYPSGIYYYKEEGYDTQQVPRSAGLLAGLWWMKCRPLSYSLFVEGRGAVVTNDWCITCSHTFEVRFSHDVAQVLCGSSILQSDCPILMVPLAFKSVYMILVLRRVFRNFHKLCITIIYRKNSNKCMSVSYNNCPSGEKGRAISRGYKVGSWKNLRSNFPFPVSDIM